MQCVVPYVASASRQAIGIPRLVPDGRGLELCDPSCAPQDGLESAADMKWRQTAAAATAVWGPSRCVFGCAEREHQTPQQSQKLEMGSRTGVPSASRLSGLHTRIIFVVSSLDGHCFTRSWPGSQSAVPTLATIRSMTKEPVGGIVRMRCLERY